MEFDDIKAAILKLDEAKQRKLVVAVLPEIWPNLVADAACIKLIRQLIDDESIKQYQQEHIDHI